MCEHLAGCDARAVHKGHYSAWLSKVKHEGAKAKWLSSSNRRYFTIDFNSQTFFYSHTEDRKKPQGQVPFSDIIEAQQLPQKTESGNRNYGFILRTKERQYELYTNTYLDAQHWVDGLNAAANIGSGAKLPASDPPNTGAQAGATHWGANSDCSTTADGLSSSSRGSSMGRYPQDRAVEQTALLSEHSSRSTWASNDRQQQHGGAPALSQGYAAHDALSHQAMQPKQRKQQQEPLYDAHAHVAAPEPGDPFAALSALEELAGPAPQDATTAAAAPAQSAANGDMLREARRAITQPGGAAAAKAKMLEQQQQQREQQERERQQREQQQREQQQREQQQRELLLQQQQEQQRQQQLQQQQLQQQQQQQQQQQLQEQQLQQQQQQQEQQRQQQMLQQQLREQQEREQQQWEQHQREQQLREQQQREQQQREQQARQQQEEEQRRWAQQQELEQQLQQQQQQQQQLQQQLQLEQQMQQQQQAEQQLLQQQLQQQQLQQQQLQQQRQQEQLLQQQQQQQMQMQQMQQPYAQQQPMQQPFLQSEQMPQPPAQQQPAQHQQNLQQPMPTHPQQAFQQPYHTAQQPPMSQPQQPPQSAQPQMPQPQASTANNGEDSDWDNDEPTAPQVQYQQPVHHSNVWQQQQQQQPQPQPQLQPQQQQAAPQQLPWEQQPQQQQPQQAFQQQTPLAPQEACGAPPVPSSEIVRARPGAAAKRQQQANHGAGSEIDDLLGDVLAASAEPAAATSGDQLMNNYFCTGCDHEVLRIDGFIWRDDVEYMFFRNNWPNAPRLRKRMISRSGCSGYCCQCSWKSAEAGAELVDVAEGLRWRVVRRD